MTIDARTFETLVQQAFAELPEVYREACRDLVIRSPDLPSAATSAALELDDPYQLLGLYHGINLAQKSVLDLAPMPDMVEIYRLPIAAYAAANGFAIETVVRHVLIHEIGHHFGFSDDDMEAIEARSAVD